MTIIRTISHTDSDMNALRFHTGDLNILFEEFRAELRTETGFENGDFKIDNETLTSTYKGTTLHVTTVDTSLPERVKVRHYPFHTDYLKPSLFRMETVNENPWLDAIANMQNHLDNTIGSRIDKDPKIIAVKDIIDTLNANETFVVKEYLDTHRQNGFRP